MSALFYIVKIICWLSIGTLIDLTLDSVSIVDRLPTLVGVCIAIFIFEVLMEKCGGNKKLADFVQDK